MTTIVPDSVDVRPRHGTHPPADPRSPFVPLLILALTLAGWFAFQTLQLTREKGALDAGHANQEKSVQDSKKLRDSLDALARETALLADKGNANARLIVDELRKRGVTINPNAGPPAAPK